MGKKVVSKKKKKDDTREKWKGIIVGAVITAIVTLCMVVPNNIVQRFYDIRIKRPQVFFEAKWDPYAQGYIGNEIVPVFAGNKNKSQELAPTVLCTLTNKNEETICIENIIVEVVSYMPLDDLEMKNPAGGADRRKIYWWNCDITNEPGNYYAKATDEKNDSDSEYSAIKYNDIEKEGVMISTDIPGMYEIKVIAEYVFRDKMQSKESDSMKFIYDPNRELTYITQ